MHTILFLIFQQFLLEYEEQPADLKQRRIASSSMLKQKREHKEHHLIDF